MNKQSQVFRSGAPGEFCGCAPSKDLTCGYIKVDPNSVNPEPYQYRELMVPEYLDKLKRGENYSG